MHLDKQKLSLLAGPLLFILLIVLPWPAPMSAKLAAGITAWMAVWWIAEPVALAVTSLLPMVLFPATGILPLKLTAAEYSAEIVYLFFAGFIFGKAIEHWQLHRRIALGIVAAIGDNPQRMLLGFMVATAFVSMWISNTATAAMMTPVAVALLVGRKNFEPNFAKCLLLGVGYAASIGGVATLVGTPTNAVFVSYVNSKMNADVSFWNWFRMGLPYATLLLLACWRLLIWLFPLEKHDDHESSREKIRAELALLGKVSRPERRLIFIFLLLIFCWLTGSLVWYEWLGWKSASGDTTVAIAATLLLFLTPSGRKKDTSDAPAPPLMTWELAEKIPWGVILFFGGGLAMARGFDESGLATWLGGQLESLQWMPVWLVLLIALLVVVALSEVASNIATASMMMPVLYSLAAALDIHPFGFLVAAAMAASIGFGLPVATAPNTIVFSAGFFSTREMARAGFLLDLIAVLLLMLAVYVVMPLTWGISL